jgi:uncharacterized protein
MKRISISFLIILFVLSACKKHINKSSTYNQIFVQDYALLFSNSEKDSLTQKIINYEAYSSNEICVYTIDSLPKNTKVIYHATTIASKLSVGKKEKDNGLLILISQNDKQIAIATGIGTEKILTDNMCKIIIDGTIIPEFKKGKYFEGIDKAIDSIIKKWH